MAKASGKKTSGRTAQRKASPSESDTRPEPSASATRPEQPQNTRGIVRRIVGFVLQSRVARWTLGVATGLVMLPLVLTLVYKIPGTRPISTLMLADLVTFQGYEREWRPLDELSDNLKHSVIMSEDGQFCSHHGVDLGELKAVVLEALEGESPRGASTLTMQVAKNLFLWPGRSVVRKALEVPLAIYIDAVLSKPRILEIYLNIAEWAPGNRYGIVVGARHHFGIDANSMNRRTAALLAVTLPNPHERNPAAPTSGMSRVAGIVERRARGAGPFVACIPPQREA